MKLPFINKLSAVTGVFARLNPMALVAKFKSRKTNAADEDEDRDFLPSGNEGDGLFADLGDLDQLDAEAKEKNGESTQEDDFGDFDNKELDEFDENEFDANEDSTLDEPAAEDHALDDDDEFGPLDDEESPGMSSSSSSETGIEDLADFDIGDGFGDEDDDEDDEKAQKAKLKKLGMLAGGGVVVAMVLGGLVWWLLGGEAAPPPPEGAAPQSQETSGAVPGGIVISLDDVLPPTDVHKNPQPFSQSAATPAQTAQGEHGGDGLAPPADGMPATTSGQMSGVASGAGAQGAQSELARLGLEVQMEPGVGVVIPASTPASYEKITRWPAAEPLAATPVDTLVEPGDNGLLPKIGPEGKTPLDAYARPAPKKSGDPKIAIIVTGLGMSRASTEAAIATMPADVALSLDVYARGLDFWVKRARTAGHEVLLNMPSESSDFPFSDPGPAALKALAAPDQNIQQLEWILSRTTGYFGVLSVYGSKFLTVEEQVKVVMENLKKRGVMYVDGGAEDSLGSRVAYQVGAKWATVDLTLDNIAGGAALELQLLELEALAKKRAIAIARISVSPLALQRLSTWLKSLEGKGLQLVPVSSLANKQLIR